MNNTFEQRVRAAAAAGWWTLLIAAAFLVLQWLAYLTFTSARPGWVLSLLGPEVSWSFVQNLWFWMAAVFKLCVWLLALVVIWLTLWSRQLRSQGGN
jgi:hypothetical protein